MDPERLQILFGADAAQVVDEYDLTDESDCLEAVERFVALPDDAPQRELRTSVRSIIVSQILNDEPPAAWLTARRLADSGLDREAMLSQMSMVLGEHLSLALSSESFDVDGFVDALASLPLPTADEIAIRLIDTVRARSGISVDDLLDATVTELATNNRQVIESLVDRVFDGMVDHPLHLLPGDETVFLPDMVDGRTFVHRLSDAEAEIGVLSAGFDLGAFARFETVRLEDGTAVEQFSVERDHLGWHADDGWLADFEPGCLLAVTARLDAPEGRALEGVDAAVAIEVLDVEPALTESAVEAVRSGYEALVDEPGLPVAGEELALWLLFHHSELFDGPQPPLAELCAAAGLEQRGGSVAHDEAIWRREVAVDRFWRMSEMVSESEWRLVLGNALEVLDDPDAAVDDVRKALDECAEPETLEVLADVLFPHYLEVSDEFERGGADAPGRLFELVDRSTSAARRPREIATAEYLACVLYERCGVADVAEQHLKRAVDAQPRLGPAVERMGWYRFDRGDARGAMKWWRTLSELPAAAATIEPFLSPSTGGRKLGRNDPCWCGSGRKFKQCHLNANDLPALPDRVGWLCRKASLWLEHAVGDVRGIAADMVTARATGAVDTDPVELASLADHELSELFEEAITDPIAFDAALNEGGLFALFLRERGELLPADEQLLAASWSTIDRSVHEVVDVDPGNALTLRDLATGEVVDVRERTASRTMRVGERHCARVVPDGESHQMIGGVFPVRTGDEEAVLDLCATGDGVELCAWVAALNRPPKLVHRPGMADDMFDRGAIEAVLADHGDLDEDEAIALLGDELSRQAQARWLDEHVPALGGLTPREAAADPTRREQLERLLAEFDTLDRTLPEGAGGFRPPGGFVPMRYDTAEMRRELGLD